MVAPECPLELADRLAGGEPMRLRPVRAAVRRPPDAAAVLDAVVLGDREDGGSVTEARQDEVRRREAALAVAERRPDAGIAEADDVGTAGACQTLDEPGMPVDPPPLLVAQVRVDEARLLERAVTVPERRPDARVAEADDSVAPAAGEIGDETRMLVHAPPLVDPEVREHERRLAERAVAVAECRPDAGVAEAHEIGRPAPAQASGEPGMLAHAPALVDPELGQDETCFAKAAGAVAECRPDARVAEADDVSAAGVGEARTNRGCLFTRQPWSKPKLASTNCASWNVPSPLPSATQTPAFPKPTMSA